MIGILPVQESSINDLILLTASNVKTLLECSKERFRYQHRLLPTLPVFIKHTFYHCHLTPDILIVALVYLNRLKNRLPHQSKGEFDTPYKMFIASIVLASKFTEDSSRMTQSILKFISPLYSLKEVNEMERSFLAVVKFNLFVDLVEVDQFVRDHKGSLSFAYY
ncbi:cyclin domain-containing protein [Sporodiniella umbellata]|nr:cyclin domain-containing protein [Sporodiniella umbellata]